MAGNGAYEPFATGLSNIDNPPVQTIEPSRSKVAFGAKPEADEVRNERLLSARKRSSPLTDYPTDSHRANDYGMSACC